MTRWTYGPDAHGGSRDLLCDGRVVIGGMIGSDAVRVAELLNERDARIASLEVALRDMLDCHDGYHEDACDDRAGAYADAEYDHPANRPEERDCDCGDVGGRRAARDVLERGATRSVSEDSLASVALQILRIVDSPTARYLATDDDVFVRLRAALDREATRTGSTER